MGNGSLNWRRWAFILGMAGCAQFIVLTVIAMFFYPGGTKANPETAGYSFWSNFFSDLGRTATYAGDSNTVSSSLFITALLLGALVLVFFFAATPACSKEGEPPGIYLSSGRSSVQSRLFHMQALACAGGPPSHNTQAVRLRRIHLVPPGGGTVFRCHIPQQRLSQALCVHLSGFCAYPGDLPLAAVRRSNADTTNGVRIQATGQKIVVYAEIVCMFIQSYGALKIERRLCATAQAS